MTLGLAILAGLDNDVARAGDELGQVDILNVGDVLACEIRYRLPLGIPSGAPTHVGKEQTHAKVIDHLKVADLAFAQDHETRRVIERGQRK